MSISFEAEELAYHAEYGRALSAWTDLEEHVYLVARMFFPLGMTRNILGMAFTGIQGFHSKLQFADRALVRGMAGMGEEVNKQWNF